MSNWKIGLQCLWCIGLLGCQKVGSSSIKTSGMYAAFSVTATGDGSSHVRAALQVGGPLSNTFVDLQPGDSFGANTGGAALQALTRTPELLGAVSYTGTLAGDNQGTPFVIALTRTSDVSAPSSTTSLPAKITLSAPLANAVISRATAFPITWTTAGSAAGDVIDVTLTGPCVQVLIKGGQTDNGQLTIMASELKAVSGSEQMTCAVQVTVARKQAGTVDPAYGAGGQFFGIQQATTSISSTP